MLLFVITVAAAAGRGLWQPQEELVEKLRRMYGEMDDELEGIK
jgi:hypothetical protein